MAVNIGPKIGIEGEREYRKAINDLITQQKTFSAEMRELESSFDDNTSAMEKNRKKSELLNKQIENQEKQVEELQKGLEAASEAYGEDAAETDKWKQAVANAKTELNNMKKELGKIPSAMSQVGKSMQDVGKKMQSIGSSLTTHVTVPLAAIGAASIAAFNEVDEGMDIIVKKTGATGEALEAMQTSARNIATTIPTSFSTAGEAIGEVNTRFGLTGDALEDLSTKFIKFADLNDTDVSSSIDSVQKLMQAYGVSVEDAGTLLDALNKTGQDTGISMDTLEASMLKNAAALKDMGLDAYDAAAFLGQVETSGADTSTVMAGLSKAMVNASADNKDLSTALSEFDGVMNSSKSDQEKLNEAMKLFGKKAGPAIFDACKQGSLSFETLSNDASKYIGSVETTFDNTLDPVDKLKVAINNAKDAGANIGGTLLDIANPAIETLGGLAKSASEWFSSLDENEQQLVSYAGVFAAGMGPAITVLGKLVSGAGSVVEKLGAIPGAGAALGEIAVPVAVAAAAFLAVKKGIELANEEAIASVEGLQEMIDGTKASINALQDTSEELSESIESTNESIKAINDQAEYASDLVEQLYRLDSVTNKTVGQQERMQEIVEQLNEMYPGLSLEIDKTTGTLNKGKEAVAQYIQKAKDLALIEAYTKGINDAYEKLAASHVALREAEAQQASGLNTLYTAYHQYYEALENAPTDVQTGQKLYTDEVQRAETAYNAAKEAQMGLNEAVKDAQATITNAEGEVQSYQEAIDSLGASTEDTKEETKEETKETKENTEAVKKNSEALKDNVKAAQELAKSTATVIAETSKEIKAWDDLYKATYDSISGQIGLFDEWTQEQELTAADMLKNLQSQTEAYQNYADNLETLSKMAVDSADPNFKALVQSIADMGMDGAGYLQELVDTAEEDSDLFNNLIAEYGNTEAAKKNAAKITTDVKNEFTSKAKIIAKGFDKTISTIGNSKVFKNLRNGMKTAVADAQSKTKQWQSTTQSSVTSITNSMSTAVKTGFSNLVISAASAAQKSVTNTQERFSKMELKPSVHTITVPDKVASAAKATIQTKSSGTKPQVGEIVVPGKRLTTAKKTIITGTTGAKPTLGMLIVPSASTKKAKETIQKGASGARPTINQLNVRSEARDTAKQNIEKSLSGLKGNVTKVTGGKTAGENAKKDISGKVKDIESNISKVKDARSKGLSAREEINGQVKDIEGNVSKVNNASAEGWNARAAIAKQIKDVDGSVGNVKNGGSAGWNARVAIAGQIKDVAGSVGTLSGAAQAGKDAHTTAQNNFGKVTAKVELTGAAAAANEAVKIIKRNAGTVYIPVAAKNQSADRPMANGGFITHEQVILAGEENKPEVVIPLSDGKRSRALDLYQQTGDILGVGTASGMGRTTTQSLPSRNTAAAGSSTQSQQIIDIDKIYSAVAAGAARGMEKANIRIYTNNREVGRVMRDMGVQFA